MNILFFILGDIQARIVNWGVNNMKAILDQNIVFFGPIEEKEFKIKERNYPIVSFNNVIKVDELFDRLPDKWYPDIVVCDVSILNFIPDIYKCPAKTYLLGRDGWGDISFNRGITEFFDYFSYNIIDRNKFLAFETTIMPLLGMPVSIPEKNCQIPSFKDRNIDVIAIANYNSSFYHERFKVFYKFAEKYHKEINIKYISGINRREIHDYYKQSKIVLDWAHTLSNRSYEAALNGCLLFSHKDNFLMENFWKPFEEYIPYDDNNLGDLILYYLENSQEASEIIRKMRKKLDVIPSTFGGSILFHLEEALQSEINIEKRIERAENLDKGTFNYRIATGFYFYYFYKSGYLQKNWEIEYFNRIEKAISLAGTSELMIPPLIEAARLSFLLNKEEAILYIDKLKKTIPDYAWLYYMRAKICFSNHDLEKSLIYSKKALEKSKSHPLLLSKFPLPFSEHKNVCDGRRVTKQLWNYDKAENIDGKALCYLSYKLIGEVYFESNSHTLALEYYNEAFCIMPLPEINFKMNVILFQEKKFSEILRLTNQSLLDSPYNSFLHFSKFIALIYEGKRIEAKAQLSNHIRVLKAFKKKKKMKVLLFFARTMLVLSYLGLQPGYSIILKAEEKFRI